MKNSTLMRRLHKGFTLLEIMLAIAVAGMGAYMLAPSFRGSREAASANIGKTNAENLMKWVAAYRSHLTGANVDGTGYDNTADITITRANHILSQIDGDLGGGYVIIEQGTQFPATATFPAGFKETAQGVFSPVP